MGGAQDFYNQLKEKRENKILEELNKIYEKIKQKIDLSNGRMNEDYFIKLEYKISDDVKILLEKEGFKIEIKSKENWDNYDKTETVEVIEYNIISWDFREK